MRSRNSAVGSSQNGPDKASFKSARGNADISQHVAVEAGEHIGVAPVAAAARDLLQPMSEQSQQQPKGAHQSAAGDGQNGDIRVHFQSPFNEQSRRQNRPGRAPEPPENPTRNLWKGGHRAPKRLISETNVFNPNDRIW